MSTIKKYAMLKFEELLNSKLIAIGIEPEQLKVSMPENKKNKEELVITLEKDNEKKEIFSVFIDFENSATDLDLLTEWIANSCKKRLNAIAEYSEISLEIEKIKENNIKKPGRSR